MVIAFSNYQGQAKWESPEQTLAAADPEVGIKVVSLKTQGPRELSTFYVDNVRRPACQAEGPCYLQEAQPSLGLVVRQASGTTSGLSKVWLSSQPAQSYLAPSRGNLSGDSGRRSPPQFASWLTFF